MKKHKGSSLEIEGALRGHCWFAELEMKEGMKGMELMKNSQS